MLSFVSCSCCGEEGHNVKGCLCSRGSSHVCWKLCKSGWTGMPLLLAYQSLALGALRVLVCPGVPWACVAAAATPCLPVPSAKYTCGSFAWDGQFLNFECFFSSPVASYACLSTLPEHFIVLYKPSLLFPFFSFPFPVPPLSLFLPLLLSFPLCSLLLTSL